MRRVLAKGKNAPCFRRDSDSDDVLILEEDVDLPQ